MIKRQRNRHAGFGAVSRGTGGPPVNWSEAIFNSYHGHLAHLLAHLARASERSELRFRNEHLAQACSDN